MAPPRTAVLHAQVAAAVGGRFVSVFDGSVAYQLDKWVHARHAGGCGGAAWPPLWSCMFCFETEEQVWGRRVRHACRGIGSFECAQAYVALQTRRRWPCTACAIQRPCAATCPACTRPLAGRHVKCDARSATVVSSTVSAHETRWLTEASHPTPHPQALAARFPEGSKHLRGALVLLRVRAKGHAFAASGGRWAVESVMAERVLAYTPRAPGELFLDYSGGAFAGGGRL